MSNYKGNIINAIQARIVKYGTIENLKNFCRCRMPQFSLPPNVFSRDRKMTLADMINFLLFPRSKSNNIELLEFSHLTGRPDVNKSDFSRRRAFIPAEYIEALNDDILTVYYHHSPLRLWYGRLLMAGDGTTYTLPDTPRIAARYLEGRKTGHSVQALARGVVLKDVLNDIVVGSNMECYGRDEIQLLLELLEKLPDAVKTLRPVIILDRKYCAYTLIAKMLRLGIDFIVRVKEKFNEEVDDFIHSGEIQQDVVLHPASTTLKKLNRLYGKNDYSSFPVRLVRMSDNVVVMTSVKDAPIRPDAGSGVYHQRWDDETTIGFFKNCLQVEVFSGISNLALQQDFHAKTIIYNLLSVVIQQAAKERHDEAKRRINRNVALGIFRLNFAALLVLGRNRNNNRLHLMLTEMIRYTEPVIEGRHYPRVFRKIKHSGKYATMQNYRRAI